MSKKLFQFFLYATYADHESLYVCLLYDFLFFLPKLARDGRSRVVRY